LAGLSARIRPLYDDLQPLQSLEPARHLDRDISRADRLDWHPRRGGDRQFDRQGAPLGGRRKRGAYDQAIGRSRGGRTTKIHALTDAAGRPRRLSITPDNLHDVMMASELLSAAGPITCLIADKAYDTNKLRHLLAGRGIEAVIPSITRNRGKSPGGQACGLRRLMRSGRKGTSVSAALSLAPR
jgi:transposase